MDKVLFGDNQFFAVNHISDEKSLKQSIRFNNDSNIIEVIDIAKDNGINTFMCTTHDRIYNICDHIRKNSGNYKNFKIYPCMPYAHKYANSVTELGIGGTIKKYVPGNYLNSFIRGGKAILNKDYIQLMKLLIDSEMKMFHDISTPVIFLQNVLVDLLLGLQMKEIFIEYDTYIREKYNCEPGYITMNMPKLFDLLNSVGIENPIICSSFNKIGFRVSGGIKLYSQYLDNKKMRFIAMQVLAGGSISPKDAIEFLNQFKNIESVLFGASTESNIIQTNKLIMESLYHN